MIFLLLLLVADAAEIPPPNAFDAGWKGEKVCELLFENAHTRALRCTFPPGVGHEKHWHAAHWGYAVAGAKSRITDANGARETAIETGGSWWSDGIGWHETLNIGDKTGIFVIVEPKGVVN